LSGAINLLSSSIVPTESSKVTKPIPKSTANDLYYNEEIGRWVVRGVVYDKDDKATSIETQKMKGEQKPKEFLPPPKSKSVATAQNVITSTISSTPNADTGSITGGGTGALLTNLPPSRKLVRPPAMNNGKIFITNIIIIYSCP